MVGVGVGLGVLRGVVVGCGDVARAVVFAVALGVAVVLGVLVADGVMHSGCSCGCRFATIWSASFSSRAVMPSSTCERTDGLSSFTSRSVFLWTLKNLSGPNCVFTPRKIA